MIARKVVGGCYILGVICGSCCGLYLLMFVSVMKEDNLIVSQNAFFHAGLL